MNLSSPMVHRSGVLQISIGMLCGCTAALISLPQAWAQVVVTPARETPMPGMTNTVPFPGQSSPESNAANDESCDYACLSRRYQEEYMRKQCQASGNREYFCSNKPLSDSQRRAIEEQRQVLRGQYGVWRDGVYYTY